VTIVTWKRKRRGRRERRRKRRLPLLDNISLILSRRIMIDWID
jgi:hypothetical protein